MVIVLLFMVRVLLFIMIVKGDSGGDYSASLKLSINDSVRVIAALNIEVGKGGRK